MPKKLTYKQEAFKNAYLADGNATQAAEDAGYKGNRVTLQAVGAENLKKPLIIQAIQEGKAEIQAKVGYDYKQAISALNLRLVYLKAKASAGDVQAIQAQTAILREKNEITGLHKQIIKREETVPVLAEEERQVLAVLASQYKAGLARSDIKVVRKTG